MAEATVVYKYEANCSIPFIFIRYDYNAGVPAGSEISELVELPMFAPLPNYANDPKLVLGGNCYAIRIAQIGVACLSANYDLRIFNKFGEFSDLIDSVNEVLPPSSCSWAGSPETLAVTLNFPLKSSSGSSAWVVSCTACCLNSLSNLASSSAILDLAA